MKIRFIIMAMALGCVAGPATAETDCLLETPAEVAVRFYEAMGAKDFTTAVACLHPDLHAEYMKRLDFEPNPRNRERMDAIAVRLGAVDFDELREWGPERIMAADMQMQVDLAPVKDDRTDEIRYDVLDQRVVSETEAAVILRVVPAPGYPDNNIEVPLGKTEAGCWRLRDLGQFFR